MSDSKLPNNDKSKSGWLAMSILLALFMLVVCFTALSKIMLSSDPTIRWDMPVAYSESNFQTQNAKEFTAEIHQCTDGGLDISVHGGGSLYKGGEIKRAVQVGLVPIGERLLSSHFNENPLFGFDSLPFITANFEESDQLWRVAKSVLEKDMNEEQLTLLYSVPWPPSGLYFKQSIENIEQLKNIKFRSYNAATARFAELSGMIPVQIEAAELSQALALGVVESFMASGSTGYDRKVWEHLSHFYDVKAWLPRNYVFVNKTDFSQLPDEYQQCVLTASENAELRGAKKSKQLTDWYLQQLEENGMQVVQAGSRLDASLAEIGKSMVEEWLQLSGEKGVQIINRYESESHALEVD